MTPRWRKAVVRRLSLASMFAYFTAAPEGHAMLVHFAKLTTWWFEAAKRSSIRETEPGLPNCPDRHECNCIVNITGMALLTHCPLTG